MLIFNKFTSVDHLYYIRNNDIKMQKLTDAVKNKYIFNDYKYGIKLGKKYKLMIFDIILTRIYEEDLKDKIEFEKILEEKEKANLFLLEYLYVYLDNLELDCNIIIVIGLFFLEETLLLLENIFNCFESVKLYKFTYNVCDFSYIYCKKFKKKEKRQDKLSDNFLLKRSSDVILIIVAVSTSLLLLGSKKTEKNP
jgi:hypothetical protein